MEQDEMSGKDNSIVVYSSPGMKFHSSVCKWYRSLALTLAKDSAMPEGSDVYDEQEMESSDDEGDATASPSVAMGNLDAAVLDRKPPALPSISEAGPHAAAERAVTDSRPGVKATARRRRSKPKHQKSQKPEGYPSRNRSAYNYFFQAQRAVLLEETKAASNEPTSAATAGGGSVNAGADVGFENMAKTIAKRWKELTPEELEPFQKLAREDMIRYRREMEEYQQELVRQSRIGREKAAAEASEFEQRRAAEVAAASVAAVSSTAPSDSGSLPSALTLNTLPSSQHDQAIYANAVLAHLDSLLQQHQGNALASSPSAAEASSGGLVNAAASVVSQALVRQPWNLGSLPSAAPSLQNPLSWNLLGIQQHQQSLLQQQQLEVISNAAQIYLLQNLLGLPSMGAASAGSRLSGHAQPPSSSDTQAEDESSNREDAFGEQKERGPRKSSS